MTQDSIDLIGLVAVAVLTILATWTAVTTRSKAVRFALIAFMFIMFALMVWNLSLHGGMHAV
jgi:hypothetical protein